jgi:hypothetical protein
MRASRSAGAGLVAALAVAGGLVVAVGQSDRQLPLEPMGRSGGSVTPAFEGWYPNTDGSFSLLIGYYNRNESQSLDIPVGPNNRIEPGGPDQGQPTHFLPHRQLHEAGVFTITVPKDFGNNRLTWTIVSAGQTISVPMGLIPLYKVSPLRDEAMGNTPPLLRFEPGGRPFSGPPREFAAALSTTLPNPLTLTVWLAHEAGWKIENSGVIGPSSAISGPDLTIAWSKFRGPGDVMFGSVMPRIEKPDGRATTTATFSEAGDYVLRAQVNDASGVAGSGFQCCWTNGLVKVTVKSNAGSR